MRSGERHASVVLAGIVVGCAIFLVAAIVLLSRRAPESVEGSSSPARLVEVACDEAQPADRLDSSLERIKKEAELTRLTVRVVARSSQEPIAAARVVVRDCDPAVTDERGAATVVVPANTALRVFVAGGDGEAGYDRIEEPPLAVGEERERVIELVAGRDLVYCASVVDESDVAVSGADVTLLRGGAQNAAMSRIPPKRPYEHLKTDAAGRFQADGYTWQGCQASIEAEGFARALVSLVDGHRTPLEAQTLRLRRAATLAAHVRNEHHAPARGASVIVSTDARWIASPEGSGPGGPTVEWRAVVDGVGMCEIEGLPPGAPLVVEIEYEDRRVRQEELWIGEAGRVEREWTIGCEVELDGLVLDPQLRPVSDAELWVVAASSAPWAEAPPGRFERVHERYVSKRAVSDPDGTFRVEGLTSGDWWIGLAPDESTQSFCGLPELVSLAEGTQREHVRLQLDAALTLAGVVLGADGEPIVGHTVIAMSEHASTPLTARTDQEGRFEIAQLAPGSVRVRASGDASLGVAPWTEARAGDGDVVVRLEHGALVQGTILDGPSGQGVAAQVTATRHDTGALVECSMSSWSGPNGLFSLLELPPGSYDLCAVTRDGRIATDRVDLAQNSEMGGIVLAVQPGAKLRFEYTGDAPYASVKIVRDGLPVAVHEVRSRIPKQIVAPEGDLALQFIADGELLGERRVSTNVGEELTVSFP